LAALDPLFFGHIGAFLSLTCKPSSFDRTGIPAKRLLVVEDITSWEHLCTFLEKPVPNDPFPATETDVESTAITKRAQDVWKSLLGKILESTVLAFIYFLMLLCAAIAAFYSATRYTLFSRIKAMLFSAAVFVVGMIIFLLLNMVPKPAIEEHFSGVKVPPSPIAAHFQASPIAVAAPIIAAPNHPTQGQNTNRNKSRQNWNNRRGRQTPYNRLKSTPQAPIARAPHPATQFVAGWSNVQQQITDNDLNSLKARAAEEKATAHLPRPSFQQTQVVRDGVRREVVNFNFN
jgi:hypothetical protein